MTREELEAMSRDDLKALLDERGVEYAPNTHTPTLVDLALESEGASTEVGTGESTEAEATESEEVGKTEAELAAEIYAPTVIHVYELPANTAAAQAYINAHPDNVDMDSVLPQERVTAAQEAIIDYGDPDNDPRMEGYTPPAPEEPEEPSVEGDLPSAEEVKV